MTPASVLGGPCWSLWHSPKPPSSDRERGGRQVATGREAGVGCLEGARAAPSHRPAAAPLAKWCPTIHQPRCRVGPFLQAQAFQSCPGAALTHPQAVADSGNKTSLTAGSSRRPGLGKMTAGPAGAPGFGLAAKQTAIV